MTAAGPLAWMPALPATQRLRAKPPRAGAVLASERDSAAPPSTAIELPMIKRTLVLHVISGLVRYPRGDQMFHYSRGNVNNV